MGKLLKYFRGYYWVMVIFIIGFTTLQVLTDLELIDYLGDLVQETSKGDKSALWDTGVKMIICTGIGLVSSIFTGYLSAKIGTGFSHDVRKELYKKIQNFSMEEMDTFSTSSLITRSTNDVTQVQNSLTMTLRLAIMAPLEAIIAIIKAAGKAKDLSFMIIIGVILVVIVMASLFILVMPKFKRVQLLTDKLNLVTRENLTGLRVARAYNASNVQKEKFDDVNVEITKNNVFINRAMGFMMPAMGLIMNGIGLAVWWVGATLINKDKLLVSSVIEFQQYSMVIIMSFMFLAMLAIFIPRGIVSGNRIMEVLATKNRIVETTDPEHVDKKLGVIEFRNVSFKYPNAEEEVLHNISFKVKEGTTTAFIGTTGSGKSTLINLIPRFFDITDGDIFINGVSVKNIPQKELRDLIGYVPQKGVLFSGTIRSNLLYGNESATEEEMNEAIAVAQAKEFVSRLEKGLDSPISQGGKNVSGGQKQRLSIARAIIKKPAIYIFDDSFSALDFKTDRLLRNALSKYTKESTNLIVAQRIGTIMNADQIIVLEEGRIVGKGTHQELLNTCDTYKEIAYSQLSKEELE